MNRRKKKLIRSDLQIKIVFITLFVASLVLLINFQMSLAALWSISIQPVGTVESALDQIRHVMVKKFLISVAMAIPLAVSVGILYSFKFSGPIYRFKKYFLELVTGRWDERCSLRKGDDLKDVCDSINAAVGTLRERIRESHHVLQEARRVLDEVSYTVDTNGKARVQSVKEKIDREDRVWKERFPSTTAADTAAPATPEATPTPTPAETQVPMAGA
jgi:methyl-accepting chemotaxis protein